MRQIVLTLLMASFLTQPLFAEETEAVPPEAVTTEEASPIARPVSRLELRPQVSVLNVGTLAIQNPGFDVDYLPLMQGLPTLSLNLTRRMFDSGRFAFSLLGSAGYGYRSATVRVTPQNPTSSTVPDSFRSVATHWIPLSLGARVQYQIPGVDFFRPAVAVGGGIMGLLQRSANAALDRNLAVPYFYLSPNVTFLDATGFHWLGGFSFGATAIFGLSSSTDLRATSLDLSIHIIL